MMQLTIDTWMPLYVYDFLGSTAHLALDQQAAYLRLLMYAWKKNGDVPADERSLLAITSMRRGRWKNAKDNILAFFYMSENGTLRQRRLDRELVRAQTMLNQRSEAGKASAAKRRAGREAQQQVAAVEEIPAGGDMMDEVPPHVLMGADSDDTIEEGYLPQHGNVHAATDVATNHATNPATKTQRNGRPSPSPLHQTIKPDYHHPSSPGIAREREHDEAVATNWGQWRAFFQNEYGVIINENSVHDRKKFLPLATGWLTAGVSFGQMREAIGKARAEAKGAIAYLPGYVDRVLASMSAPTSGDHFLDTKWCFDDIDRSSDIAAMEECIARHGIQMPETFNNLDFAGNPMPEFTPVPGLITERDFEHIPIPEDFSGAELGSKSRI